MRFWGIVISIIVILAFLSSPVLAISKSDLISQYKTGQFWTPVPTPTPTGQITPFEPLPTPKIPSWFVPSPLNWKNDSFAQPSADWKIFDDSSFFLLKKWKAGQISISSYAADLPSKKPNIYLYSDLDLTARVWLAPEDAITVSDPVYQQGKGWLVQIRNGSLNGKGDFLFYESLVPYAGWQKNEGYVIRAASREQDLAFMLGRYGFNEKETLEFIDYWSIHLAEDVDYVFYPQETGAVERVMPLFTSPEPDHISRIWFYAEPLVSAPEPVTSSEKIVREGFYVVEWGVMIK